MDAGYVTGTYEGAPATLTGTRYLVMTNKDMRQENQAHKEIMPDTTVFICGGNYAHLEPRGDCPNSLHDWPLPNGYVDGCEMADARLRYRWKNVKCPDCSLYGWLPGEFRGLAKESKKVEYARNTDAT
jgi:hypothetical protein